MFDCVAIVGVGLMGGSLGMALRARGLARRVVGVDRDAETLARAVGRGAVDAGGADLAAVTDADCVVFATPVGVTPDLMRAAAPHARPDSLVTDLGSTKARIVAAGESIFGERFAGGHPMAGSEAGGIAAARADLFEGAAWCVVRAEPPPLAGDGFAARLAGMAAGLGARPVALGAEEHDRLVALASHLPHVLAFAFAHTVRLDADESRVRSVAAGSFRDQMRVSASDPALWGGILADNRDALLSALDAYQIRLDALRAALTTGEAAAVETALRGRAAGVMKQLHKALSDKGATQDEILADLRRMREVNDSPEA